MFCDFCLCSVPLVQKETPTFQWCLYLHQGGRVSCPVIAHGATLAGHPVIDNGQLLSLGWESIRLCDLLTVWPARCSVRGSCRSPVEGRLRGSIKYGGQSVEVVWRGICAAVTWTRLECVFAVALRPGWRTWREACFSSNSPWWCCCAVNFQR